MVVLFDAVAAEDVVLRVDARHPARVALQLLLRRRLARCKRRKHAANHVQIKQELEGNGPVESAASRAIKDKHEVH